MVYTVTSGTNISTHYASMKKIAITSDGTIHVVVQEPNLIVHYFSRDGGQSWSSQTVDTGSVTNAPSICKDSNDNLYVAYMQTGAAYAIYFRKGTVTKGTPWTWSWGAEKVVFQTGYSYLPDIIIDHNGYFHIVIYRSDNSYIVWARCTDGVGNSWTIETIPTPNSAYLPSIYVDSNNNLFVFAGTYRAAPASRVIARKITYNGGVSWTVGSQVLVSSVGSSITGNHYQVSNVLPSGKFIVIYSIASGTLYFRKTSNAWDISSWGSEIQILSSGLIGPSNVNYAISVLKENTYRVIYVKSDNTLCYKETTDGGATWGAENLIKAATNTYPNAQREEQTKAYYIWRYGTDPYTIYMDFFASYIKQELTESLLLTSIPSFSLTHFILELLALSSEIRPRLTIFHIIETLNLLPQLRFLFTFHRSEDLSLKDSVELKRFRLIELFEELSFVSEIPNIFGILQLYKVAVRIPSAINSTKKVLVKIKEDLFS